MSIPYILVIKLLKVDKTMKYTNFCQTFEHNSAASSVVAVDIVNKRLLFAIEDERLLRRKYNLYESNGRQWIQTRLNEFGLDDSHIQILDTQGLTNAEHHDLQKTHSNITGATRGHFVAKRDGHHHLKHALSAYYQSGFKDASILVLDGCDYPENGTSIAIFTAKNDEIYLDRAYGSQFSLGLLYAFGCIQCGFSWNESGKLMGLSTYGKLDDSIYEPFFIMNENTGNIDTCNGLFHQRAYVRESPSAIIDFSDQLKNVFIHYTKPNTYSSEVGNIFSFKMANIAALIQRMFEDAEFSILKYMRKNLPSKNLIITGGCGLNCVANGKIIRSKIWDNFFVPPMCDDSGNSVGAAIQRYGIKIDKPLIYNNYIYPIPPEYNKELSKQEVASYIKQGRIIAWFEGGSEYGPRALCHRSLLANPELRYMAYRVNEIKNRDYWRPLSPVVLDTHFVDVFQTGEIHELHKIMLATEYIRERWKNKIKAVCAIDGSSRPQVLTNNKYNKVLYSLMKDYNLPILLNTSMNDRGEPICETPEDAIKFCDKNEDVILVFVKNDKIYTKGNN